MQKLGDSRFQCTNCIIQFTAYQAQKPHLLFALFLARLKRKEDDEVGRESALFAFPAPMNPGY